MKYHVTYNYTGYHIENKTVTEYDIEADTPLQAAQMAHAMFNGCTDFSTGGECRTAFERYADRVKEDTYYNRTFISDSANKNRKMFTYDNIAGHSIFVEW